MTKNLKSYKNFGSLMSFYTRFLQFGLLSLLLIFSSAGFSQGRKITITGTVTDSARVAIQGASIVTENKSNDGTSTDANGKFVLDVEPGTVLHISFVGFQEQKVTINANITTLNIILVSAIGTGEEMVVVAYGKKLRREAVTGAVTSISPGALKIPSSNLTTALAGQVAGLVAFQQNGQPGVDNASFFIRGVTTFGYKQDPLILIDNIELTATDLARLQVDDIESFSILKDASSTALYGARGANGVILVTTKQGKEGKAKINFRVENSISQNTRNLKIADPITYMNLFNEALKTRKPTAAAQFTPNYISSTLAAINKEPGSNPYVYPAVDWLDMLFKKTALTQRANMSVSGGGGVAKYYVSGSYNLDNGNLRRDTRNNNDNNVKYQNYQIRSNVNINVTKSTELIVRLAGTFNEFNGPLTGNGSFSTDLYNLALHSSPVLFPAFYPADSANIITQHILFGNAGPNGGRTGQPAYNNPYALMSRGHKTFSESRMSAQLELNQGLNFITKGLALHGIFSTNRYSYFENSLYYNPFYYNIGSYDRLSDTYSLTLLNNQPGQAQEYLNYNTDPNTNKLNTFVYLQAVLDYSRQFGNHNFSSTLIGTRQQTLLANQNSLRNSLPYRNIGLAGRTSYAFKKRYFLEFNFGYNGSERFSPEHRFGFFPTVGGSWIVSEEKFWDAISPAISRFKLRATYGLAGNDAIGSQRFFFSPNVGLNEGNPATFGVNNTYTRNGVYVHSYENNAVTWETSRQTNLGVEFTILKSLNITADFYKQHRYDILLTRASVPSTVGLEGDRPAANLGTADSKGIDLHADFRKNFRKDLWASFLGNLTLTSGTYGDYEEPQYNESYRYRAGQTLNQAQGYIAERLFVDDKEAANSPSQIFSTGGAAPKGGDIKYRDLNNDGKIDGADVAFIGLPLSPQVTYGFGASTGIKNFDLNVFFQGNARVSFFIDPSRVSPFIQSFDSYYSGNTQLLQAFADDHWSEANQNLYATYPRLGTNGAEIENNRQPSTWWMRDGSFMRLKSLEVGYTLPKSLSKKMKISTLRIYFNGLNLLTWSKFKLWDPELGGNAFNYPIQKIYNMGVNLNF